MREAGDAAKGPEPLVPVAVEPSAEEGATVKKSKKRKVAEAQAVQAQAAEAATNGAPAGAQPPMKLLCIKKKISPDSWVLPGCEIACVNLVGAMSFCLSRELGPARK